jgi:hypothetical protein
VCAACSAGKDADVRAIASGLAALSPGLTRLSLNSMWRPPTDEQLRALAQVGTLQELLLAHMSCYASFTDRCVRAAAVDGMSCVLRRCWHAGKVCWVCPTDMSLPLCLLLCGRWHCGHTASRGIEALTALTSLTCLHMGEMPSNISPELGGAAGGHLTLTARVSPVRGCATCLRGLVARMALAQCCVCPGRMRGLCSTCPVPCRAPACTTPSQTGYVRKSVSQQLKELCWRCPTFREEYVQELRGELRRTQLELQGSKKDVKAARMEAQGAKQAAKRAQAEVAALRQELEWLRGGVGGAGGAWHGAGSSAGPHP